MTTSAPRTSRDALAVTLARLGAGLGVLAGLLELTVGPTIRDWVGDKQDTTRLGLATIILGCVALASITVRSRPVERHRLAAASGLLLPGLIGFSTVGRLWLIPGPLLLVSGTMLLLAARPGELRHAVDRRRWLAGLVVACGAFYIFLGVTALGPAGLLGVLGGLLVWTAVALVPHARRSAAVLLVVGALPFAAATWWSVVTPFVAVLIVALGGLAVARSADPAPGAARRPVADTG